jgi:hypothetical protein
MTMNYLIRLGLWHVRCSAQRPSSCSKIADAGRPAEARARMIPNDYHGIVSPPPPLSKQDSRDN